MRLTIVLLLLLAFGFTGCLSTVRVKRDSVDPAALARDTKDTSVKGIPFYVKVAKCKQQSIWAEPVYTLSLKRTTRTKFVDEAAAKEEAEKTKQPEKLKLPEPQTMTSVQVLSLTNYEKTSAVRELQAMLNKATIKKPADVSSVEDKWDTIASLPTDLPPIRDETSLASSTDAIMIANTSTPESLVDYSRAYYYNSPRPWVGSSQVDVKLASDGTMTEGSTQVQSQTLSTFVSALPISSVLTGVAKAGGIPLDLHLQKSPFATTTEVEYELAIQQEIYKHTHTAYAPKFTVPCEVALGGVAKDYALTVEAPGSTDKKDDPNTVKVNGTVVLPKQSGSTSNK